MKDILPRSLKARSAQDLVESGQGEDGSKELGEGRAKRFPEILRDT